MASGGADSIRAGKSEATNSSIMSTNSDNLSIEDLQKEIETLKKRIIEEREKLRDKSVVQVAEGIEAVNSLNVKVRRSLRGHNAKVLCLDWSIDKRHLVSSSQVSFSWCTFFGGKKPSILTFQSMESWLFRNDRKI